VEFIETVCGELQNRYDWLEPSVFGHFGDGNLHFNMGVKPELDQKIVFAHEKDIHAWVHQRVLDFGGTISAEHGIGQLKRETMRIAKDPVALEMMRAIKRVFDPNGRLNPNRLLPN
jgi:FAD/FMN-containing dehydrogenase